MYIKFIKWHHTKNNPLASNGNNLESRTDNRSATLDTCRLIIILEKKIPTRFDGFEKNLLNRKDVITKDLQISSILQGYLVHVSGQALKRKKNHHCKKIHIFWKMELSNSKIKKLPNFLKTRPRTFQPKFEKIKKNPPLKNSLYSKIWNLLKKLKDWRNRNS